MTCIESVIPGHQAWAEQVVAQDSRWAYRAMTGSATRRAAAAAARTSIDASLGTSDAPATVATDIRVLLFVEPDQTMDDVTTATLVLRHHPTDGDGWVLYFRDGSGTPRSWIVGGGPKDLDWARQRAAEWVDRAGGASVPAS